MPTGRPSGPVTASRDARASIMTASASRRLALSPIADCAIRPRLHDVGDRGEAEPTQGQGLAAEQFADEGVAVAGGEIDRTPRRHHRSAAQHDDLRGEIEGLDRVMGDEQDGFAGGGVDAPQLRAKIAPGDRIHGPERLVHEQDVRIGRERPCSPTR